MLMVFVVFMVCWNWLDLLFDFLYGVMFCGFLCYKMVVLVKIWDIFKSLLLEASRER